jgi:hypothetical protein
MTDAVGLFTECAARFSRRKQASFHARLCRHVQEVVARGAPKSARRAFAMGVFRSPFAPMNSAVNKRNEERERFRRGLPAPFQRVRQVDSKVSKGEAALRVGPLPAPAAQSPVEAPAIWTHFSQSRMFDPNVLRLIFELL